MIEATLGLDKVFAVQVCLLAQCAVVTSVRDLYQVLPYNQKSNSSTFPASDPTSVFLYGRNLGTNRLRLGIRWKGLWTNLKT